MASVLYCAIIIEYFIKHRRLTKLDSRYNTEDFHQIEDFGMIFYHK